MWNGKENLLETASRAGASIKIIKEHKALPCIVAWALWIAWNDRNFQGKDIIPIQVCFQIKYGYGGIRFPMKVKNRRMINQPDIYFSKSGGFFNGACQNPSGACGSGGILYLSKNHSITFKAVMGQGTKNKSEPCALWILFKLAADRGIATLHVIVMVKLLLT